MAECGKSLDNVAESMRFTFFKSKFLLVPPLVAHCYVLHIYNLSLTCEIGD